MNDHMLDKLNHEIELSVECIAIEKGIKTYKDLKEKEPKAFDAIKALINAYNKIVEYYYLPEYVKGFKIAPKQKIEEVFNNVKGV